MGHIGTFRGVFPSVLIAALLMPSMAVAEPVPVELRAAILVRGLAYERGLTSGSGDIHVLVVGEPRGRSSRDAASFDSQLRGMASQVNIGGRRLRVRRVTYNNDAQVLAAARQFDAKVIYVAEGLDRAMRSLSTSLIRERRLVMCGEPEGVGRGCILSVEAESGRPRLVIDLSRARRAGLNFDARLLRLSRVVQ